MTNYGGYAPPAPQQSGQLAGWWYRVGATVIDAIITGVVAAIFGFVGGGAVRSIVAIVFGVLYTVLLLGSGGRTLGNMAVGTATVAINPSGAGRGLGYGTAFLRWLVQEVLAITVIGFFLDVLWPLWDERNQTLHDKAASTLVVKV